MVTTILQRLLANKLKSGSVVEYVTTGLLFLFIDIFTVKHVLHFHCCVRCDLCEMSVIGFCKYMMLL